MDVIERLTKEQFGKYIAGVYSGQLAIYSLDAEFKKLVDIATSPAPVEFELSCYSTEPLGRGRYAHGALPEIVGNRLTPFIGKRVKVVVSVIHPTDTRQGE